MGFDVKGITVEINGDTTKLSAALRQIDTQFSGLSKVAGGLKKAINNVGKDHAGVESFRAQAALLEQQIAAAQAKADKCKEAMDNWDSTMARLKDELADVNDRLPRVTASVAEQKRVLQSMKTEYKATGKSIEEQKVKYQETCEQMKQMQATYKGVLAEQKNAMAARDQEVSKLASLNNAYKKASDQQVELTNRISTIQSKIVGQSETVENNKQAWLDASTAYEKAKASGTATEAQLQKMSKAVTDAHQKWTNSKVKLEEYENTLSTLKQKLTTVTSTMADYKAKIETTEASLQKHEQELTKVNKKVDECKKKKDALEQQLNEEKAALDKTSDSYKQQAEAIRKSEIRLNNLEREYGELTRAKENLEGEIKTEKESLEILNAEYRGFIETVKYLKAQLHDVMGHLPETLEGWGNLVGGTLQTVGGTIEAIASKFKYLSLISGGALVLAAKESMDFESAWTGVLKTVEGSDTQLEKINTGLKELAQNTSSSYEAIAKNAELAGQMGVATDNVLEFTEVVTKLGDTTNLVGEEAAQTIAKFANVMTDSKNAMGEVSTEYFSRLGSTIVDLGNNFATTEADIMNLSMRMAAAGSQIGMTSPQVLALATALSSMGLKTNEAGGSMSKLMQKIALAVANGGDDLEMFASASKMSADEFKQAWETDAPNAFLHFLETLSQAEDGSARLKALSEAGLTNEIRLARSVGALTGSIDIYKDALNRAGSAWEENSAMEIEAAKRYDTLAAQLNQAKEAIKQVGDEFGKSLTPMLKNVCQGVKDVCNWFMSLDQGTKDLIVQALALTAAIYPVGTVLGKTTKGVGKFITEITKAPGKISKFVAGLKETGALSALLSPTFWLVTGALVALTAATATAIIHFHKMNSEIRKQIEDNSEAIKKWDDVSGAVRRYTDSAKNQIETVEQMQVKQRENTAETEIYFDTLGKLSEKEKLSASDKIQLQQAIEGLNGLYPEMGFHIDEATGKLADQTGKVYGDKEALEALQDTLVETAKKQAAYDMMVEAIKGQTDAQHAIELSRESIKGLRDEFVHTQNEFDKVLKSGDKNEIAKKSGEMEQAAKAYNERIKEAIDLHHQNAESLKKSTEQTMQALYDVNPEEFYGELDKVVQKAQELGVKVPENFAQGIRDGSISKEQAIRELADLSALTDYMGELDLIGEGKRIPQELVDGIIANSDSVSDACQTITDLIDFSVATEGSDLVGTEIATALANALANGQIDVQTAVDMMNHTLSLQEGAKKVKGDTSEIQAAIASMNGKGNAEAGMSGTSEAVGRELDKSAQITKKDMKVMSDTVADGSMKMGANMGKGGSTATSNTSAFFSGPKTETRNAMNSMNDWVSNTWTRISNFCTNIRNAIANAQAWLNNNPLQPRSNPITNAGFRNRGNGVQESSPIDSNPYAFNGLGAIGATTAFGAYGASNGMYDAGMDARIDTMLSAYSTNPYNATAKVTSIMQPNTPMTSHQAMLRGTGSNAFSYGNSAPQNITIEIPLVVNGREFARATATDIQKVLDEVGTFNLKLGGAFR